MGNIKCIDKTLVDTYPLCDISSPFWKGQASTIEIKNALQTLLHQKFSLGKAQKHDIKKDLNFLYQLAYETIEENVDSLIDVPKEDYATTCILRKHHQSSSEK
jgi:hypothetical protein